MYPCHLLFLNIGGGEIMVIALFVLMFFGSKQIPELMRGLGKGMREVKDAMNGIEREVKNATSLDEQTRNSKPVEQADEPKNAINPESPAENPNETEEKKNS